MYNSIKDLLGVIALCAIAYSFMLITYGLTG